MDAALAHALRLLENGQAHDARYVCSQILTQMPQHPGALQCMGQALSALGQYAEALQAYGVALALQPRNVHLHTGQGAALLRLGHPREALECFIRACALAPPDFATRAQATEAAEQTTLSFFDPASPYLQHMGEHKALCIRTALHALNDGHYERASGDWYRQCRFRRVVVVHNVDEPHCLLVLLQALALPSQPKIELVFASEWMHQQLGLPGHFEPSPIDTTVFAPATAERRDHAFVVGRLSRDTALKYHPGAPAFFTRLADAGMQVRLMGATVLAPALPPHNGIELLAAGAVAAHAFLQGLDCFTYRTHTCFPEAWGRVVMEAMAVGLPVVVHATGGYAQVIDHGRNGFLFHSDDEAFALLSELQSSPALRRQIGNAARETVQALYGEAAFDRSYGFYIG